MLHSLNDAAPQKFFRNQKFAGFRVVAQVTRNSGRAIVVAHVKRYKIEAIIWKPGVRKLKQRRQRELNFAILTILELNWFVDEWKFLHFVPTTAKHFTSWRAREQHCCEMYKNEKCTCKACKSTVFFVVKYANLWRACRCRPLCLLTRFICKNLKTSAFNFSAPKMSHVRSSRSVAKTVKSSSTTNPNLPKRDLATKYFGEHLYSLPVGVIGQETVVRSEKSRRKRWWEGCAMTKAVATRMLM